MKNETSVDALNKLKLEAKDNQKNGLPYILASIVIWALIIAMQLLNLDARTTNLYTFASCCLLTPLAILFAKLVKADIFKKTKNPINKLALLCTLNQFLYILIVMWAFDRSPDSMLMIYAMVFGAHLLPFSWIYNSKAYLVMSIVETLGALIIGIYLGNVAIAAFIVVAEIILSTLLFKDCKKLA
ncbi:hypothetical protein IK146_03335 [Candidatus Saccharibacteria bacterium]|nr:hypothetical protein [Candidatus Saccharibacteria bacterium]